MPAKRRAIASSDWAGRPFDDIKTASLPTRYTDTAVETVALADVDKLAREMVQWMEGR